MNETRWESYRVQPRSKKPILDFVTEALEQSGASVISEPSASEAPFLYEIRLPSGEHLSLLCYAFLANEYRQGERPADEHRFQIKYGSDFDRYHDIFIDPTRKIVTLFFGVHLEEKVFIAVDPAMHTPTWFSSSVEVKLGQIEDAQRQGWIGFERDRAQGRRKAPPPMASNQTEAVAAFTAPYFARYIELERLATGLDAGERLLLVDRLSGYSPGSIHPLEDQFGLSAKEILDVIWGAFRLEAAVRGGVAELHLKRHLEAVFGPSQVDALDEDGRPDFRIRLSGRDYLVECKNALRRPAKAGPRVDFQKTRASKSDPCSRYYERDGFDLLAACLHPITQRWEFRFCRTAVLKAHPRCPGRLSPGVVVAGEDWFEDIRAALGPRTIRFREARCTAI